ncbi:MAG: tetratricopeptide repeat protein [Candidatus Helarchaeota archaeon]
MKEVFKQSIEYINKKEYGKALDLLLALNLDEIREIHPFKYSKFFLVKGILWELVKNLPKAYENYKKALEIDSENLTAMQYFAQILSKRGDYPKAREIFNKWLQLQNDKFLPFNINRGFLGFRYRTDDIYLLENFKPQNQEDRELKILLLGLYYFSIFDLQKALSFFNKINNPTSPIKIMKTIAEYILFKNEIIVNDLKTLKLEGKKPVFSEINKIIRRKY